MKDGFVKVGSVSPRLRVADVSYNIENCIKEARAAAMAGVKVLCYPELAVTGYSCGDIFNQRLLVDAAERAVSRFIEETRDIDMISFIGVPVPRRDRLYNCAAVVFRGRLLGLVAKTYIPNYQEFYEARYFETTPEDNIRVNYAGQETFLGSKLIFVNTNGPALKIACEICEDVWVALPPSSSHATAGANIVCNLSASDEVVGKAEYRRRLISMHSSKTFTAYIYTNAGDGESTTDMVFSAHNIIAECGDIIAEAEPFSDRTLTTAEIDISRISTERRRTSTFVAHDGADYEYIPFELEVSDTQLEKIPSRKPFISEDPAEAMRTCDLVFEIQSRGLAGRVERSYSRKMVIGVSGGLDSTLALLVCAKAADKLGMPRTDIVGVTMPCFGTTRRTKSNAEKLCDVLGVTLRTVDIKKSVTQHLKDIGHDGVTTDVTYENAQARERTQVLMDIANQVSGLVVGTGDLSELVLGWATYNGDHMSMYGVNASIPKTMVRSVIETYSAHERERGHSDIADVLDDILATPVSPELLPPKDGEIAQCTEELVGPYELHDYFIYYTLKYGFEPRKIYRLAKLTFAGIYENRVILGWLRVFMRRFFSQQFKRSCLPDGPKVGSISVSPRGDLRMPSDASANEWLRELDAMEKEEDFE